MDALSRPPRSPSPSSATRPHSTVLLATADPALRAVLQRALTLERYAVLPVAEGDAALRVARARRPAVIVLDLALPGCAATVSWRLRTDPRTAGIPLLALARPTSPCVAPLLPVHAFLDAPLDLAQFYQAIASWTTAHASPCSPDEEITHPSERRRS